jgi:hypothetical protein
MSFAINPSMNHINVPEQCIEALYRSSAEVPLADARFRGRPCEAFICISKVEKMAKAHVAILDNGTKNVLVYTSDYETANPADYPKVSAEAEAFVTAMGFTMERVNLEFSPAMREVIIKGFRVMRPPPPPPPKKQVVRGPKVEYSADHNLVNIPAKLEDAIQKEFQIDELPAELASLRTELASARAVIEKLTREKVTTEQNASREIASLKNTITQANEARKANEEKLSNELQELKAQKNAPQVVPDEKEKNRLLAQIRKLEEEAKSNEEQLRKEIAGLQEKNRHLESGRVDSEQKLASGISSLKAKITALTEESESLKSQLSDAKAANRAASDKISSLAHFETSWREGQQREEDLCRNIDLLKSELDAREKELQIHHSRESSEESLLQKVSELEAAAEADRAEMEQLRSGAGEADKYTQELKALAEGKDLIESEFVRLANESREKESTLTEALSTAEAEVQRLSRELEIQTQVAAMEQAALRAELRRIVMGGTVAAPQEVIYEQPPAVLRSAPLPAAYAAAPIASAPQASQPAPAVTEVVQPLEEVELVEDDADEPDLPIEGDSEIREGLINELGSFYSDQGYSSTEFTIDPDINSIEYSDPGEIVALFYSSNTVQAVPVGSAIQKCKGYVVGMKKSGSYLAYVVWYLTESKKSVICTPEHQPEDSSECISILKDAVTYFEIVGFMMEFEELGSSTKSYRKAFKKVPALKRAKG